MNEIEDKLAKIKWLEAPESLELKIPFIRGRPLKPISNDVVEYEVQTDRGSATLRVHNDQSYLMSNGALYDDMCQMDILNEP